MREIVRGDGMKYQLEYNGFGKLESIGVDGKGEKLIRYWCRSGNGVLKRISYANGHTMCAGYDALGRMTSEKWYRSAAEAEEGTGVVEAYYKYIYDRDGNISSSIDMTGLKEYNYYYEDGRIVRSSESEIEVNGSGVITSKKVMSEERYSYGEDGKLVRKLIRGKDIFQTEYFSYPEDGENAVKSFFVDNRPVTSRSKSDGFGRRVFDELQFESGFVSRQFVYRTGEVTDEHVAKRKLKSSPTTDLVSRISLSGGRTIDYEYDAEGRITKVIDTVDGTTEYTYDALGWLLTETVTKDGVSTVVNTMTYDNYGNILSKNGKVYTYGDNVWKDLLTSYNGQTITYDAQGNPTNYLGHTLTWEKGRQLKRFAKSDGTIIDYAYNANGIRTSKTVDGIKHTYTVDGTKILCEVWGNNKLEPLYDNEDNVCGIVYNNIPYYFRKNLQGDVIALVNGNAQTVARYTHDAWGVPKLTTLDNSVNTVNADDH